MTENNPIKDAFGEYERLAAILRETDLSGKSKIRHSLKNRLLSKAAGKERRFFSPRKWLLPAIAATLAVLALTVNIGHQEAEQPAYYQVPEAGYNIYGSCGRQGLNDYLSVPRF
ncbi:MAG: hypothetical protein KKH28_01615 [Elusimicrobia bacterium]|nr:hypothetical protein [Elusimicrobiota bacterium]